MDNQFSFKIEILFYLLIPFLLSCATSSSSISRSNSETVIDIDWLLGDWIRINEQEGKTTFEHWKKQGDRLYVGKGLTISGSGDTLFRENLQITPILNHWTLIVTGVNNSPTKFLIESVNKNEFIAQNLENEFPKFIKYANNSGQLKAQVYNDEENKIDFLFKKLTH